MTLSIAKTQPREGKVIEKIEVIEVIEVIDDDHAGFVDFLNYRDFLDYLANPSLHIPGSSCPSRQNANRVTPSCAARRIKSSSSAASVTHSEALPPVPRRVFDAESRVRRMASR
jgi:hypothetical protein